MQFIFRFFICVMGFASWSLPLQANEVNTLVDNVDLSVILIVQGFLACVTLVVAALYVAVKAPQLRSFSLYALLCSVFLISLSSPELQAFTLSEHVSPTFMLIAMLFAIDFSPQLKVRFALGLKLGLQVTCILSAAIAPFINPNLAWSCALIVTLLSHAYILFAAYQYDIKSSVKGSYLIAWLVSSCAVIATIVAPDFIVKSANSVSYIYLHCIIALHVLCIGLTAVQYFSNSQHVTASRYQNTLSELESVKREQQQLIDEQTQQQEELESIVQERTFELEVTLRELQDKNAELEEKNTLDALTGIRNRRFFDKKLLAEYRRSRREQSELSLIMLDIDFFKKVNDNHGHQAGDDVIRRIAKIAEQTLKRPSDSVSRYGGEEFAIILPATDQDGATALAESIRIEIEASPIHTCEGPLDITASLGLSTMIANREQSEAVLLKHADKALYLAKEAGRNQVKSCDVDVSLV